MNINRIAGLLKVYDILKNDKKFIKNIRIQQMCELRAFRSGNPLVYSLANLINQDIGNTSSSVKMSTMFHLLSLKDININHYLLTAALEVKDLYDHDHESLSIQFGYKLKATRMGSAQNISECLSTIASIAGLLINLENDESPSPDLIAYSDIELYVLIMKLKMLKEEHLPLFAEYQFITLLNEIFSHYSNVLKLYSRTPELLNENLNLQ